MNAILQQVKDPAWWFTAVFVGIIVSIGAAYSKDYITLCASRVSKLYAAKRTRDIELNTVAVDFYSGDHGLVILAYVRAAISALYAFSAMGVTLLLPIFYVSVKSHPELDSVMNGPLALPATGFGILSWILFALAMRSFWRMDKSMRFAHDVYLSFKRKSYPEALR